MSEHVYIYSFFNAGEPSAYVSTRIHKSSQAGSAKRKIGHDRNLEVMITDVRFQSLKGMRPVHALPFRYIS